jgi:hypothetical protein
MTFPQPQDWQSRIRNIKIDLDRLASRLSDRFSAGASEPTTATSEPLKEIDVDVDFPKLGIDSFQQEYQQIIAWFNGIPSSGKLLAIVGGGLLSLTLIKTVFQLITSLITLSTFGIILYLGYRFWILPKGE